MKGMLPYDTSCHVGAHVTVMIKPRHQLLSVFSADDMHRTSPDHESAP